MRARVGPDPALDQPGPHIGGPGPRVVNLALEGQQNQARAGLDWPVDSLFQPFLGINNLGVGFAAGHANQA